MDNDLQLTMALLKRTPAALDALLRDLPPAWTLVNEGGETWTAFEVIGHLVYAEEVDWVPRAKLILRGDATRPFDPFNRLGHREICHGKSLNDMLDEFSRLRSDNLTWLASLSLQSADFERIGTHPTFGNVTLSQLLATWAVHDLTHIRQIARVMAHQYREAVGPWQQYLGILATREQ